MFTKKSLSLRAIALFCILFFTFACSKDPAEVEDFISDDVSFRSCIRGTVGLFDLASTLEDVIDNCGFFWQMPDCQEEEYVDISYVNHASVIIPGIGILSAGDTFTPSEQDDFIDLFIAYALANPPSCDTGCVAGLLEMNFYISELFGGSYALVAYCTYGCCCIAT